MTRRLELMQYVDRSGECWLWLGKVNGRGYGQFAGRLMHRWVYEIYTGAIPSGHEIDHLCSTRACLRPDHLEAVTHAENVRRTVARGRWRGPFGPDTTHCVNGHEFNESNTYLRTRKGTDRVERVCRPCRRGAVQAWKLKQRGGGVSQ